MKRETHVLTVALLSAICISGYALEPTAAAVFNPIVPSATPSPRKKATPRPIQSPVTKRTSANTNIGTGNQVESARTQSTVSAVQTRTETVDNNETITIHQRKTPTAGNQPGVQQRRRTNTATPKSQPRAVKKNQDIEVENDETHVARPSNAGSNSALGSSVQDGSGTDNANKKPKNGTTRNGVTQNGAITGTPNRPVSGIKLMHDGEFQEGEFLSPNSTTSVNRSANGAAGATSTQSTVKTSTVKKPKSKSAARRRP